MREGRRGGPVSVSPRTVLVDLPVLRPWCDPLTFQPNPLLLSLLLVPPAAPSGKPFQAVIRAPFGIN